MRVGPACLAPSTSLHLDPLGDIRACCQNSWYRLGRYPAQTLLEAWNGAPAQELRFRLARSDFGAGCHACAEGALDDLRDNVYARRFDHLADPEDLPAWPVQLELQLSTRCNLQCTMCTGQSSSAIRSQREHLPPLPRPYDAEFFRQLREFLPHVRRIELLGGEPFLAEETRTLVSTLDDLGLRPRFHVTTNGTVWTPWVESFISRFDVDITVSIEGSTTEVFEAIRVGASFAGVMANLDRFVAVAEGRGTTVSIATCLMRESATDLFGLLVLADERDVDVYVNTVTDPSSSSLALLPATDLAPIVARMEHQASTGHLLRNRTVWDEELRRLHRLLARPVDPSGRDGRAIAADPIRLETWAQGSPVHTFFTDHHQLLTRIEPDPSDVFGLDLAGVIGQPLAAWIDPLRERYGEVIESNLDRHPDGSQAWTITLDGPLGRQVVRAICLPEADGERWLAHLRAAPTDLPTGPTPIPVPTRRARSEHRPEPEPDTHSGRED